MPSPVELTMFDEIYTAEFHNLFDTLTHLRLVAVYMAFFALGFWVEGTFFVTFQSILQKLIAIVAQLTHRIVMCLAVHPDKFI
jgi:hypothetical protein